MAYRAREGVYVANGKFLKVGDEVWIWRNQNSMPALVRKVVSEVNGNKIWSKYPDSWYGRREESYNCYATEREALQGRPDLSGRREHAYMRAGRLQGARGNYRFRLAA